MIQIAQSRTIRRWSGSKLANGKLLIYICKENTMLVEYEWTEKVQAEVKIVVAGHTWLGLSG